MISCMVCMILLYIGGSAVCWSGASNEDQNLVVLQRAEHGLAHNMRFFYVSASFCFAKQNHPTSCLFKVKALKAYIFSTKVVWAWTPSSHRMNPAGMPSEDEAYPPLGDRHLWWRPSCSSYMLGFAVCCLAVRGGVESCPWCVPQSQLTATEKRTVLTFDSTDTIGFWKRCTRLVGWCYQGRR